MIHHKEAAPNPTLYLFFKFLSFTLIIAIVCLLLVIYYITSRRITPSLRVSNKKFLGDIAYLTSSTTTSSQLNIFIGKTKKIVETGLKYPANDPRVMLYWSPDGNKVVGSVPSSGSYYYYDVSKSRQVPVPLAQTQNNGISGWLSNNEMLVYEGDTLYSLNISRRERKQLCGRCYFNGLQNAINTKNGTMIIERESGGTRNNLYSNRTLALLTIRNRSERPIASTDVDVEYTSEYSFDIKGENVLFIYRTQKPQIELSTEDSESDNATGSAADETEDALNYATKVGIWHTKTGIFSGYPTSGDRGFTPLASPSGDRFTYIGSTDTGTEDHLMSMKYDGTDLKVIGSRVYNEFPYIYSWSPDANWITYGGEDGELRIVSSDGRENFVVIDNGRNPQWSPKGE